jgi:hypothetical protein
VTAAIAVAAVVWGWGLAQYPYLFPTSLSIAAGSAPIESLAAEFFVVALALLLVVPGFALLYALQQRRLLTAAGTDAQLRRAADLEPAVPDQPAAGPASVAARVTTALVLAVLTVRAIRDVFAHHDEGQSGSTSRPARCRRHPHRSSSRPADHGAVAGRSAGRAASDAP